MTGEFIAIQRLEIRRLLFEHALQPDVIPIDFDIAHMAELPKTREPLARNALPGCRRPVPMRLRDGPICAGETLGKFREIIEGDAKHCRSVSAVRRRQMNRLVY